jgi:cytidine deaminase
MRQIKSFADLRRAEQQLVARALLASGRAYAPYSGVAVGAAVRTRSGSKKTRIVTGANLENASYPLGICAEVAAIAAANAFGQIDIEAIAVVGHRFTSPKDADEIVTPCGRCRQVIFEASEVSGIDIKVFSCNGKLSAIVEEPISKLLPVPFGPENLGFNKTRLRRMRVTLNRVVSQLLKKPGHKQKRRR